MRDVSVFSKKCMFWLCSSAVFAFSADFDFGVDASSNAGEFQHFWLGSGLQHPGKIEKPGAGGNYILIGSVPFEPHFMRNHGVIRDLVRVDGLDTDTRTYDWTDFDEYFDLTVTFSKMKTIFEFMGSPEDLSGSEIEMTPERWKNLAYDIATHLIERYGREEVRTWIFQDYNEGFDPDQYDAVVQGLVEADPELFIGGEYVKLEHIKNGPHYFTGEGNIRHQWNGYHSKSTPKALVDRWFSKIHNQHGLDEYPEFKQSIYWANWETDREWGWSQDGDEMVHRTTPYYSAWKAATVNEYLQRIINDEQMKFWMNFDDAFGSENWTNRCQMVEIRQKLVKKPIHNVLYQLTMLGDTQLDVTGFNLTDKVGIIPTKREHQVAVLLYHYNPEETFAVGTNPQQVSLNVTNLPFVSGKVARYRLDSEHGNIFKEYQDMGFSRYDMKNFDGISLEQVEQLRMKQELPLIALEDLSGSEYSLDVTLTQQSVELVLITRDPESAPEKVQDIRFKRFDPYGDLDEIYVMWDEVSRNIKTYELYHSATGTDDSWERINPDMIATAFGHPVPHESPAFYKVRAIDYWDRVGEFSDIITTTDDPVSVSRNPSADVKGILTTDVLKTGDVRIRVAADEPYSLTLFSAFGRKLNAFEGSGYATFHLNKPAGGTYFLKLKRKGASQIHRIVALD